MQLEIVDLSFWNSLDWTIKHCKNTKHFPYQLKSVLLSIYNNYWFHFGACLVCSCVFGLFAWKAFFFFFFFFFFSFFLSFFPSLCIFVETFVTGMIVSGLYGLLIMSAISCFVFMFLFGVWYWNKVWYDDDDDDDTTFFNQLHGGCYGGQSSPIY